MSDIPNDPKIHEYAHYLVYEYIGDNSNFPLNIQAAFTANLNEALPRLKIQEQEIP